MFANAYAEPGSIKELDGTVYCLFKNVGTMYAHAGGFIASDLTSSLMKAGSVLDIMAAMQNSGRRYYDAVNKLVKKFAAVLPVGMTDAAIVDAIAKEATLKRRVYNALICQTDKPDALPGTLALKAQKDLSGVMQAGCVSYLTAPRMVELKKRLEAAGIKAEFPAVAALIVPYFSTCYEVACIDLIFGKTGDNMTVWLTGHHIALSCLLATRPSDEFFLEASPADALRDIHDCDEQHTVFIALRVQPDGKELGWVPRRFLYVDRGDPLALVVPSLLVKAGSACIVTTQPSVQGTQMSGSVTWSEATAGAVLHMLERDGDFTQRVMCLLDTVRGDMNVKTTLRSYLQERGEWWLASRLDMVLRDGTIWQGSDATVYATSSGYIFENEKNMDVGGEHITNFTLTPQYSITYEGGEMYHVCMAHIRGEDREIILGTSCFDAMKKLTESMQKYIALTGKPTIVTPMVFDTGRGRVILPYLHKQFAELPVRTGVSYLGWNATRTQFIGPDFRSTADAIEHKPNIFKPEVDYLRFFKPEEEEVPVSNLTDGVPECLLTVIKQCAGIIVRSYANHEIRPVTYLNNEMSRDILQSMFSYTGQIRSVQLNRNMRASGQLACFQGYPILTIGYNRNQASSVKTGMILLGEQGPVIENCTGAQCKAAGMLLRHVMERLPQYLMQNCGPSIAPTPGVIDDVDLANEGWNAMQEVL